MLSASKLHCLIPYRGTPWQERVSGTCPIAHDSYSSRCCPNQLHAQQKSYLCHPTLPAQDAPTRILIFCEFPNFPMIALRCHVVVLHNFITVRSKACELFDAIWTLLISLEFMLIFELCLLSVILFRYPSIIIWLPNICFNFSGFLKYLMSSLHCHRFPAQLWIQEDIHGQLDRHELADTVIN